MSRNVARPASYLPEEPEPQPQGGANSQTPSTKGAKQASQSEKSKVKTKKKSAPQAKTKKRKTKAPKQAAPLPSKLVRRVNTGLAIMLTTTVLGASVAGATSAVKDIVYDENGNFNLANRTCADALAGFEKTRSQLFSNLGIDNSFLDQAPHGITPQAVINLTSSADLNPNKERAEKIAESPYVLHARENNKALTQVAENSYDVRYLSKEPRMVDQQNKAVKNIAAILSGEKNKELKTPACTDNSNLYEVERAHGVINSLNRNISEPLDVASSYILNETSKQQCADNVETATETKTKAEQATKLIDATEARIKEIIGQEKELKLKGDDIRTLNATLVDLENNKKRLTELGDDLNYSSDNCPSYKDDSKKVADNIELLSHTRTVVDEVHSAVSQTANTILTMYNSANQLIQQSLEPTTSSVPTSTNTKTATPSSTAPTSTRTTPTTSSSIVTNYMSVAPRTTDYYETTTAEPYSEEYSNPYEYYYQN